MPLEVAALGSAIFEDSLKKLSVNIISGLGRKTLAALSNISIDFGGHLEQSFEKCRYVRTILNRDESVELLSIYVNLRFTINKKQIDDYDLIERLFDLKRVNIIGGGGGGKTIFMKYLWISLFEGYQNVVPLFIELRRFNELSSDNFLSFLFHTTTENSSKIQQDDFEKAMRGGAFVLLLDGFDEINLERRSVVESAILKLSRQYPELYIVVSSRPDERFDAWQDFTNYKVHPLDQKQVIDLIGKLNYDSKIKRKFIQRIKADLFDRHGSFLSSPLLATMMLLTFDQFADIPEKIYLFYEQAFDTLFAKHDATKEAYKRKSHTALPIDSFKRLLAFFCLVSYYEQKHEYTEDEVRSYINKSISMAEQNVNPEFFLLDLRESVCILQREGLHWVYSHRSFQEYFSAYCLSNIVTNRMNDIFPKIIGRTQDNVLSMCYDMNQQQLETLYIIPNTRRIIDSLKNVNHEDFLANYISFLDCRLLAHYALVAAESEEEEKTVVSSTIFFISQNSDWRFINEILRLYKFEEKATPRHVEISEAEFLKEKIDPNDSFVLFHLPIVDETIEDGWLYSIGVETAKNLTTVEEISRLYVAKIAAEDIKSLKKLMIKLEASAKRRHKTIDEIFSIS